MDVVLCDVAPRDGLQNDAVTLEPAVRAELCERIASAGVRRVEAASFVNPRRVPQMGGAEEVFAALAARTVESGSTVYAALVLNQQGVQRAVAVGATELHLAYPLTDTFAQRNQGMTVAQAAAAAEQMVVASHAAGARVTATLAASFGCPFEGRVDPGVVGDHAERMAAAGADELMLADTIGVGVPRQVRDLLPRAAAAMGPDRPVGLHLHNTRNTGYANALTGLEHGATVFDASLGGLGGCPFAPRATGNIGTEDLVYLFEGEGVHTGTDLDGLIATSEWLAGVLGRELPGLVYKAGPVTRRSAPAPSAPTSPASPCCC